MEAKAALRFTRVAPRKARVIANMIRGKNVAIASSELRFTQRSAAKLLGKLLDSAIANARLQDDKVDLDALFVKTIFVDKAPNRLMRRWRPRAMGRATQVVKGTSHITLILSDGKIVSGNASGKASNQKVAASAASEK